MESSPSDRREEARYQSEFVKKDREGKRRFVRLYQPKRGQRFTFASSPDVEWICHPETGAVMRLATYESRR